MNNETEKDLLRTVKVDKSWLMSINQKTSSFILLKECTPCFSYRYQSLYFWLWWAIFSTRHQQVIWGFLYELKYLNRITRKGAATSVNIHHCYELTLRYATYGDSTWPPLFKFDSKLNKANFGQSLIIIRSRYPSENCTSTRKNIIRYA